MPRFLVKGRLKPGRKSELAARIKDGSLAQGAPYQEELVRGLREGHAVRDDVYFMLESRTENLPDERDVIEHFFDIVTVLRVNEVPQEEFDAMKDFDDLPEWAGVDR